MHHCPLDLCSAGGPARGVSSLRVSWQGQEPRPGAWPSPLLLLWERTRSRQEPEPQACCSRGRLVLFIEDRVVNHYSTVAVIKIPLSQGRTGRQREVLRGGPGHGLPSSQSADPALASGTLLARPSRSTALRRPSLLCGRQAPHLGNQALDAHQPLAHLIHMVHHERAVDLVSRVPVLLLELCQKRGACQGCGVSPLQVPAGLLLAPHLAPGGSSSSSPGLTASPEPMYPPAMSAGAQCRRTLVSGSRDELERGPALPQLWDAGGAGISSPHSCRPCCSMWERGRGRGRSLTCTAERQLSRASLSGARTVSAGTSHSSGPAAALSLPPSPRGAELTGLRGGGPSARRGSVEVAGARARSDGAPAEKRHCHGDPPAWLQLPGHHPMPAAARLSPPQTGRVGSGDSGP